MFNNFISFFVQWIFRFSAFVFVNKIGRKIFFSVVTKILACLLLKIIFRMFSKLNIKSTYHRIVKGDFSLINLSK